MSTPSMAEVLAEHVLRETSPACKCGWDWDYREVIMPSEVDFDPERYRLPSEVRPPQHSVHVAQALAAAGYGHVASAMHEQREGFACDMCGHPNHGDTDCGVQVGYDHLNGDHECGCPGSETSLEARAEAAEAQVAAVRALLDGAPMVPQAMVRRALDGEGGR